MTNLKDKAISIKGSEYVLVKDRILAFHSDYPDGSIVTELVSYQDGHMIVKAIVTPDWKKGPNRIFTGHSQAVERQGYINKTAALENAETSAVGRALAEVQVKNRRITAAEAAAQEQELQRATISDELLQKMWIERWDGKLPTYLLGDGQSVIMNLPR